MIFLLTRIASFSLPTNNFKGFLITVQAMPEGWKWAYWYVDRIPNEYSAD